MKSEKLEPDEERLQHGRAREGASFPAAAPRSVMPGDYGAVLEAIKQRIQSERLRAVMAANTALVLLYWDVGAMILERQGREGWGSKVIDRLAVDLRESFPGMQGLSPRNLKYMRAFAAAWPERAVVQEALAQIPWYHNIALLEKLSTPEERLWYARQAAEQGWSHNVLVLQIKRQLLDRQGRAVTNFAVTLPPADSDMAVQAFKDPYLFDFLGIAEPYREREVEDLLVQHIERFLLELGTGFAFVGRQVHLEVGQEDYYLDLLFYHLALRRYVVIELKAVPFKPDFIGQINLYLSAVDDLLRHPDDQPSIGLLLCRSKDKVVAEYALRGLARPIGVAEWEAQLTRSLPAELRPTLPTVEEIEAELGALGEEGQ
ncbi:MAG: PDDEXK nuclease domain-containing protein [Anaerolineae bacterium]